METIKNAVKHTQLGHLCYVFFILLLYFRARAGQMLAFLPLYHVLFVDFYVFWVDKSIFSVMLYIYIKEVMLEKNFIFSGKNI